MKESDWKQLTGRDAGAGAEGRTSDLHRVRRVVRVRPDGSCEEKGRGWEERQQAPLPHSSLLQWAGENSQWVPEGLSLSCQCPSAIQKEEGEERGWPSDSACACGSCPSGWEERRWDYLVGVDPVVGGQQGSAGAPLKLTLAAQQGRSACLEEEGVCLEKGAYLVMLHGRAEELSGDTAGLQLQLEGYAVPGGLCRGHETLALGTALATQGGKLQIICLESGLYRDLCLTVLRLEG